MKDIYFIKSIVLLTVIVSGLLFSWSGVAQDTNETLNNLTVGIPQVALIDIESSSGSSSISMTSATTNEAGSKQLKARTNNSLWLNYSSVVGASEPARDVKVSIQSGSVPSGMLLAVKPSSYKSNSSQGAGDYGVPSKTGYTFLDSVSRTIIENIGSTYTGNGVGNGHQLTYILQMNNNKSKNHLLRAGNYSPITVVYTISDN